MRKLAIIFVILILFISCGKEIKEENIQLKQKVAELQSENNRLNSIITQLQQTDNYYYQTAVNSRENNKYDESNKYLNEMIDRFPDSKLISEAKSLIRENNSIIEENLYNEVVNAQNYGHYQRSNELADEFLNKYPSSRFAYRAKRLKITNAQKIKEQEEANLRRGCDLELITWSWSESASGDFVEAKGQVKNISDRSLRGVCALITFKDRNGNFITANESFIDLNPILSGQTSPFSLMERYNPAMQQASIQFKYFAGGTIQTYRKK